MRRATALTTNAPSQQARHDAWITRGRVLLHARGEPLAQSGLRAGGIKTHETAAGEKLRWGDLCSIENDSGGGQELPAGLIKRAINQRAAKPVPLMIMGDTKAEDQHGPVRLARGEIAHGAIIGSDGEPERTRRTAQVERRQR